MEPSSRQPVPLPAESIAAESSVATAARTDVRIAIAHDWLCGYRGGEAVLDRIAQVVLRHFTPAGLYVMVNDGRRLTRAISELRCVTSSLQRWPGAAGKLRRWYLPRYPSAVEDLSRKLAEDHRRQPISLLISTSSAAIKGMRAPAGVPHLCYCHSPARYIWSQGDEYKVGSGVKTKLRSMGLDWYRERFKAWDRRTAGNVTQFLANSTFTASEVKRCYGKDAEVVHPPVRTGYFTIDPSAEREDFWLVVSALEPYKRVDVAIKAANMTGHRLVIAGMGSSMRDLQRLAGPSVEFLGRVPDDHLRRLYRTASVLLFPQIEDFGIVPVEAQACGLSVVARRLGGATDTVVNMRTGVLYSSEGPEALVQGVQEAPLNAGEACRQNAERFSEERFEGEILGWIEQMLTS